MVDPDYFFSMERDNRNEAAYRTMMRDYQMIMPAIITLASGGRFKGPQAKGLAELFERTPHWKLGEWMASKSKFNADVAEFYAGHRGDAIASLTGGGKKKRKPSAYNKAYAKEFKKLAPKYKKKNGQWKKNGFKNCCKECHKCCRKKVKKK